MKEDLKEIRDILLICLIAGGVISSLHSRFKSDTPQTQPTEKTQNVAQPSPTDTDSLITDFNKTKQLTAPNIQQKTR